MDWFNYRGGTEYTDGWRFPVRTYSPSPSVAAQPTAPVAANVIRSISEPPAFISPPPSGPFSVFSSIPSEASSGADPLVGPPPPPRATSVASIAPSPPSADAGFMDESGAPLDTSPSFSPAPRVSQFPSVTQFLDQELIAGLPNKYLLGGLAVALFLPALLPSGGVARKRR